MKRKQRLENFVFYDTESVTAHLEDMAQKGWALKEIGNLFWIYEKIEPTARIYGTTFFPTLLKWTSLPQTHRQNFSPIAKKLAGSMLPNGKHADFPNHS